MVASGYSCFALSAAMSASSASIVSERVRVCSLSPTVNSMATRGLRADSLTTDVGRGWRRANSRPSYVPEIDRIELRGLGGDDLESRPARAIQQDRVTAGERVLPVTDASGHRRLSCHHQHEIAFPPQVDGRPGGNAC